MDSIRAMAAALLAINPNSDSLDKGNEAGVIPNNASGSRLISETNGEALLGVKFNSQHDIDTFSKSVEEGKYVDIFSKMSSDEIDAIVDAIEIIAKKFPVGNDNSRPNVTKQVCVLSYLKWRTTFGGNLFGLYGDEDLTNLAKCLIIENEDFVKEIAVCLYIRREMFTSFISTRRPLLDDYKKGKKIRDLQLIILCGGMFKEILSQGEALKIVSFME
ncbi:hypothetical protein Tco_1268882, partial [Tanacetum coccineum]